MTFVRIIFCRISNTKMTAMQKFYMAFGLVAFLVKVTCLMYFILFAHTLWVSSNVELFVIYNSSSV
jgi:hypothetical protein